MGAGASSQAAFEQMIACTMILGDAMVQGLDPRYVRFPDMYRLYDFHVGPKKQPQRTFQGGQMVLFVRAADSDDADNDDDEAIPKLELLSEDGTVVKPKPKQKAPADEDDGPVESNEDFLVVYLAGDKIVLDRATLDQPNNDGWTPLHASAHTQNAQEAGITIMNELVKQGANLNLVTKRGPGAFSCGWTPLHIAVAYGLEALALKLIRSGADVNTKNTVGWTPLYEACHRNYSTIARELLKAGASHDVICPEFAMCPYPGQHPLAEACRQGAADTVKVLLDWEVDKNAVNGLGWTALHEAAYHNRITIIKQLIVYGVDVMVKTNKGSVARDLTIWSEIRAILDDVMKDQAPASSPKKERRDDEDEDGDVKSTSPKKSPSKVATAPAQPLSRKEDYALLGDLPSFDARANAPAIAIKDAKEVDDDDEPSSAAKPKHSKKKRKHKQADVPNEFKCDVTRKLLKDPMRSPYGQVFERKVIEAWVRDFGNRCPLTGQPLTLGQLTADAELKTRIREWKERGGDSSASLGAEQTSTTTTREAEPADEVKMVSAGPDIDPYDF